MFVVPITTNMKNLEKIIIIPKLDSSLFTWLNWKAGSIHDLDLKCRYSDITSTRGKLILKLYGVGWCYGENLPCRPKQNEIALMCFKGEVEFWFHLRRQEFIEVFSE